MERITISFYDDVYDKLKIRAEKHHHPIAQTTRELVDLGLKIEEAAASSDKHINGDDILNTLVELKMMLKTNLLWALETRLLSRFLTEHHADTLPEKRIEILSLYKQKAQEYVDGFMITTNENE